MNRSEISVEDLERLAAAMAQAIPRLDCPECCERGWKYEYMELSAQLYLEELEWSRLAAILCFYAKERASKMRSGH